VTYIAPCTLLKIKTKDHASFMKDRYIYLSIRMLIPRQLLHVIPDSPNIETETRTTRRKQCDSIVHSILGLQCLSSSQALRFIHPYTNEITGRVVFLIEQKYRVRNTRWKAKCASSKHSCQQLPPAFIKARGITTDSCMCTCCSTRAGS